MPLPGTMHHARHLHGIRVGLLHPSTAGLAPGDLDFPATSAPQLLQEEDPTHGTDSPEPISGPRLSLPCRAWHGYARGPLWPAKRWCLVSPMHLGKQVESQRSGAGMWVCVPQQGARGPPPPPLTLSQLQLTMTRSLQPAAVEDAQSSCWPNVEAVRGQRSITPEGRPHPEPHSLPQPHPCPASHPH